jgi:hypothetical protein
MISGRELDATSAASAGFIAVRRKAIDSLCHQQSEGSLSDTGGSGKDKRMRKALPGECAADDLQHSGISQK